MKEEKRKLHIIPQVKNIYRCALCSKRLRKDEKSNQGFTQHLRDGQPLPHTIKLIINEFEG